MWGHESTFGIKTKYKQLRKQLKEFREVKQTSWAKKLDNRINFAVANHLRDSEFVNCWRNLIVAISVPRRFGTLYIHDSTKSSSLRMSENLNGKYAMWIQKFWIKTRLHFLLSRLDIAQLGSSFDQLDGDIKVFLSNRKFEWRHHY